MNLFARICLTTAALLAAASCLFAQGDWPQRTPPDWATPGEVSSQRVGVGIGGGMFPVAFHPTDPRTAYLGGDMGACLAKTTNGGQSWSTLGDNSVPALGQCDVSSNIAVCASDPDVVWVGHQHGVFRSTDAGDTWRRSEPNPGGSKQCKLAADPDNPPVARMVKVAWAAEPLQVATWLTTDGGESWEEVCAGGSAIVWNTWPEGIFVDRASPIVEGEGHQRIFAWVSAGIVVTDDGGRTWRRLEHDLPIGRAKYDRLYDLEPVMVDGRLVLHAVVGGDWLDEVRTQPSGGGVYRSDDGGRTWTARNGGLDEALEKLRGVSYQFHTAVDFCDAQPQVGYCCFYAAGGVFKTEDGGLSWRRVYFNDSADLQVDTHGTGVLDWYPLQREDSGTNVTGAYKPYLDGCRGLEVAPSDPDFVTVTDNVTCWLTNDGGATWFDSGQETGARFAPEDRFPGHLPHRVTHLIRARGFHNVCAHEAAFDPFDQEVFALAYDDLGLWLTRDGGEWYQWAYWGVVGRARSEARSVAFDPAVPGRIYAGFAEPSADVRVMFVSHDAGRNFEWLRIEPLVARAGAERVARGMDESGRLEVDLTEIVVDADSSSEARRLFVGSNFGVYRSGDGGASWQAIGGEIGATVNISALRLDPADPERLYLGAINYTGRGSVNGLYLCENARDAAPEFRRLGEEQLGGVAGLAICRDRPRTMYAVAFDPALAEIPGAWSTPRIWRSDDAGESWRELSTGEQHIPRGVLANPLNPDWVYVLCQMNINNDVPVGLFRSTDGGATWAAICPDHTTTRTRTDCLTMDPVDPRRLLVYDFGSSFEVWDLQAPH